jgi:hypothetical protein
MTWDFPTMTENVSTSLRKESTSTSSKPSMELEQLSLRHMPTTKPEYLPLDDFKNSTTNSTLTLGYKGIRLQPNPPRHWQRVTNSSITTTRQQLKPRKLALYGGSGQLMEIDQAQQNARCFNCRKPGHFHRNCPKLNKRLNMRVLYDSLEDEEVEELMEMMMTKIEEKDFADGQ